MRTATATTLHYLAILGRRRRRCVCPVALVVPVPVHLDKAVVKDDLGRLVGGMGGGPGVELDNGQFSRGLHGDADEGAELREELPHGVFVQKLVRDALDHDRRVGLVKHRAVGRERGPAAAARLASAAC